MYHMIPVILSTGTVVDDENECLKKQKDLKDYSKLKSNTININNILG